MKRAKITVVGAGNDLYFNNLVLGFNPLDNKLYGDRILPRPTIVGDLA